MTLRTQVADGDLEGASETAARLSRMPDQSAALDLFLDAALDAGAVQTARTAISEAEAEGAIPSWRAAYHKARIAFETGDLLAARAILVLALDTTPGNPALRALLVETMVAAGTASDARAVLGHIGSPPVNPAPDAARAGGGMRTATAKAISGPEPSQG
ncbi:tetratricopeptide repeat protein [Rhodobacterales bacterium HKCCSP123]|nr:tetratricopeptide repeat protein [Rhodobacterales bacterium HKCCSP123]